MREHDFEPIRGLPGVLPPGERILWQGAPDAFALAREAFHVGLVAAYFAALIAWRAFEALAAGAAPLATAQAMLITLPVAAAGLGVLGLLAWLNARTTVYTITNRRVVLRFGVGIPKAINIPFGIVESAALKPGVSGAGTLTLALAPPNKIAYLQLWPHARPWRVNTPQPAFRAIPQADQVAALLAAAVKGEPVEALATAPAAAPTAIGATPIAA